MAFFLQLRAALVELVPSPAQIRFVRLGRNRGRLNLLLPVGQLLGDFLELRGDTGFQLAQAVALTGNPLAHALPLLIDGSGQRLPPVVGGRSLAK
jgi:type IV secretory pathway protease TraF